LIPCCHDVEKQTTLKTDRTERAQNHEIDAVSRSGVLQTRQGIRRLGP
jgi:hypothetical protein